MTFKNGDAEISGGLQIASAAPEEGETAGTAKTDTITVVPGGKLANTATTKTEIGTITIKIS